MRFDFQSGSCAAFWDGLETERSFCVRLPAVVDTEDHTVRLAVGESADRLQVGTKFEPARLEKLLPDLLQIVLLEGAERAEDSLVGLCLRLGLIFDGGQLDCAY